MFRYIICTILGALALQAGAFPTDTYTERSRLAEGRWVKISITDNGLYLLRASDLRAWGFSDPSRVRIYGYGGARMSDVLTLANYIDDLPEVPIEVTQRGVVFYGVGVNTWSFSGSRFSHRVNPFSTAGYYFVTEADEGAPSIPSAGTPGATSPSRRFSDYRLHENETVKLGETGHQLVGEDFKWTPSQIFRFDLTDIDTEAETTMTCQFVARTLSAGSVLKFTANGTSLPFSSSDNIGTTANSSHNHGVQTSTTKTFKLGDSRLDLGVTYSTSAQVHAAHLDFIEINYRRHLRLNGGSLLFRLDSTQALLEGASATTRIWDVTNPLDIKRMNTKADGQGASWTNDYTGLREYAAWDETATLPSPSYVGTVKNQNLHDTATSPDMVIFCRPEWQSQARRIAELHAAEPDRLTTLVVDPQEVYNEFGSGAPDVNALRRYLKMLYDRGLEAGKPLRFALLIGKPTFDNRGISNRAQALPYPTMATWQSDISLDDNSSFTTDDIFAFLKDGSGRSMGSDELCIAVGRIPAKGLDDVRTAVDKLYEYAQKSTRSSWRNQVLLLADDGNVGIHMEQSEDTWKGMLAGSEGDRFFYTKVYIDAFEPSGGTYPQARQRMFNRLDEGLLWWNYIGHANPTSWTSEAMLTYQDINNLYLRDYPILYAATCEFLNWDASAMSGAEILYYTEGGGIIAGITAVRPVYISDNGALGRAFAPMIFNLDETGQFLPIGEIYRRGKNNLKDGAGSMLNNPNKLRYVLMGDPAMRIATPSNRVVLEKINGEEVTPDSQITIMARQRVEIEGYIADPWGEPIPDFDGDVTIDIYDAEYSTTSYGWGFEEGKQVVFDEQGGRLYSGRDKVEKGRFRMVVAMPEAVADNFRPAAMNMYASSETKGDAMGINRDFYVYGFDEDAEPDTKAPTIDTIYLNHPSFNNGGKVNTTPTLFARVSDNVGFNLSSQGVGHSMTVQVDGVKTYNNVAMYFTPDMGSLSGTIAYPVDELMPGNHTLRLRVWDTSGNLAEETLECFVDPGAAPEIYEVYTDANPASTEANFYLTHNRPDAMMTVTVEVFNLLGQPVWSGTSTGKSDLFTSAPIRWDLTDRAGHRVNRGIYLYRASITERGGEHYVTRTSRIAVTGH